MARPKRPSRQPQRRSKRNRSSKDDSDRLCLLNLPRDILKSIVEFNLPEEPNERWLSLGRTGETCRVFRAITKELAPSGIDMEYAFVPERDDPRNYPYRMKTHLRTPFLLSFLSARWKGANVVKFRVHEDFFLKEGRVNYTIVGALRSVLVTPGLFPNLQELIIASHGTHRNPSILDADTLHGLAQNLPNLSDLELVGCFSQVEWFPPAQFGAFGALLRQPLRSLTLSRAEGLTDAHVEEFLRRHPCGNMHFLHIFHCTDNSHNPPLRLSDSTARAISRQCNQLRGVSLVGTNVTSAGLRSILGTNINLVGVNISDCHRFQPSAVDVLVEHAPELQELYVQNCIWFNDGCLHRLIQGQRRSGLISLHTLDITESGVTPAGLHRALDHARGVLGVHGGHIFIGYDREELFSERRRNAEYFPRLESFLDEWRDLAIDFPDVSFSVN